MDRTGKIIRILKKKYPSAVTALAHKDPLELLVATILSAQCTDKRVNMVTPALFAKYSSARAFAKANIKELETGIRSTGFYRNKAANIKKAAAMIEDKFKGKVPRNMSDLITLPGVARKTANIVLYHGFGIIEGIAVDTHVKRLSERLGFTKNQDPVKIEADLMRIVPKNDWGKMSDLLIEHGRQICHARGPECGICPLKELCPSYGKF